MSHAYAETMQRDATFSPCGRYRYSLTRVWNESGRRIGFIMLNPSTADHLIEDPTVRRCIGFARAWGFGSLDVCNLFAFRSSLPSALLNNPNPVGPGDDTAILEMLSRVEITVAAWGASPMAAGRAAILAAILPTSTPFFCLGLTKQGAPRHPLYVPADKPLEHYELWQATALP